MISPKPVERTANAYRFEVKLLANQSQTLKVETEQTTFTADALTDSAPDFLLAIVENKQLPTESRSQLKAIADFKGRIVAADHALADATSQMKDLSSDQARLRQNIDSLNRVKGQEEPVRRYSSQLGDNEVQIAKLGDQTRSLRVLRAALDGQLRGAIEKLTF